VKYSVVEYESLVPFPSDQTASLFLTWKFLKRICRRQRDSMGIGNLSLPGGNSLFAIKHIINFFIANFCLSHYTFMFAYSNDGSDEMYF